MALSTGPFKLLAVTALISSLHVFADSEFQWNKLKATDKLNWTPCYSGLQCSLLEVPLDYSSPAAGTASIAIARYPANCSKSEYRGPILLNPGGPGGSGVDYVVETGASIATVIGGQFDIVGFDPRGVSYSTPTVYLFKTEAERALWMKPSLKFVYPSLNQSADAIAQQWARAQIIGQLAVNRNEGNYIQHITTDNTARDMLRITEAFGFEKLQYWGISYGSVLGSTFAAMFPDKVGRVVVDGVLDMEAWFSANLTREMTDTDKALQTFIDGCAAAGPDACAFSAPSSGEVAANLDALSASIKTQPAPVITSLSYGLVDYTFLRNFIFDSLYTPYDSFVSLAQGLADLARGNATTMYAATEVPPFECDCNSTTPFHDNFFESAWAISCGDATPENDTLAQLQEFYAVEQKLSSFADLWGNWRVFCSYVSFLLQNGKIEARGFQGGGNCIVRTASKAGVSFNPPSFHAHGSPGPFGAPNTSFPLLVIGNTADSVTSITGAKSTVDAFPGSALLTIDSPGHTSTAVPSTCVSGYLRQYFQNGTLPAPGTVCQPDGVLFPSANATTEDVTARELDARRADLIEAGRTIGRAVRRVAAQRYP
ncbi:AB hydrolase-1 domain-containing protein [Mycena venus]|uniref:AB hydrolase-1 domain-containing protein n=1 Tax=Mycena venus TaxID=2733690 RepID=A0A8H6XR18_9AGAR|nr:AB hydrolase-1 domain-containing protein [Mycena venus]